MSLFIHVRKKIHSNKRYLFRFKLNQLLWKFVSQCKGFSDWYSSEAWTPIKKSGNCEWECWFSVPQIYSSLSEDHQNVRTKYHPEQSGGSVSVSTIGLVVTCVKNYLKSSLMTVYGRYGDLTKHSEVPLSRMLHNILENDHIQWHSPLMRHYTNFWPFTDLDLITEFDLIT